MMDLTEGQTLGHHEGPLVECLGVGEASGLALGDSRGSCRSRVRDLFRLVRGRATGALEQHLS
jgi:hypothetical protein